MRSLVSWFAGAALASAALAQDKPAGEKPAAAEKKAEQTNVTAETAGSPLDFTLKDIDGKDVALSKYKGKVVLIVNVASKCGLTPQYEQLQALHEKYAARGLAILAIPCNDFGGQEPKPESEIKDFCKSKYGVGFDLFSKIKVKGDEAAELYKYLVRTQPDEKLRGEIKWNFTKFIVGRDGKIRSRFEPKIKPDDDSMLKVIETALGEKSE